MFGDRNMVVIRCMCITLLSIHSSQITDHTQWSNHWPPVYNATSVMHVFCKTYVIPLCERLPQCNATVYYMYVGCATTVWVVSWRKRGIELIDWGVGWIGPFCCFWRFVSNKLLAVTTVPKVPSVRVSSCWGQKWVCHCSQAVKLNGHILSLCSANLKWRSFCKQLLVSLSHRDGPCHVDGQA